MVSESMMPYVVPTFMSSKIRSRVPEANPTSRSRTQGRSVGGTGAPTGPVHVGAIHLESPRQTVRVVDSFYGEDRSCRIRTLNVLFSGWLLQRFTRTLTTRLS